MEIHIAGTFPTKQASADAFTGRVWHDPIIDAPPPARIRANRVTFEPGARTAWHTHPLGQTLHVILGVGRVQTWGGPVREIKAGDTVWIPPGEKHWHGAAPEPAWFILPCRRPWTAPMSLGSSTSPTSSTACSLTPQLPRFGRERREGSGRCADVPGSAPTVVWY
jgi:quercetin dioxygenase-like cupin family protein